MISEIEIRNFRCFEETRIAGFRRVSLIGGLNNSGKTALLEALYLNNAPGSGSIITLRRLRRESTLFLKSFPQNAWDNFFFNNDQQIEMISSGGDSSAYFKAIRHSETFAGKMIYDEKSEPSPGRAILISEWEIKKEKIKVNMEATAEGIKINVEEKTADSTKLVLRPSIYVSSDLALRFDQADFRGQADRVLDGIRLIDPSIIRAKTFSIGEPTLYLKKEGGEYLPITLYGEAVSRVTDFILRIVNHQGHILLIDEIENGIHYTHQPRLWEMLFKLAVEFDIQIFATTHSLEMIRAFAETGLQQEDKEMAAYIELTRHIRTGQITGIAREPKELEYTLRRGVGVRGEQ